jgi:two-component system, NtrC family, nitrogen regulation response regulator NtrX
MANDILIVDDEADIRDLVAGILEDEGFTTRTARDSDSALAEIANRRPNLVFLDIWLQGSKLDGLQLLEQVKRDHAEVPVVMISGHGNIETAVAAIKRGAYDFIEKPFKSDRLILVATRALETSRLKREVKELKQLAPAAGVLTGRSACMNQLRQTIERAAKANSRILIVGPSGAGKELAARTLHNTSSRAEGPFIVINAAAITPERMEVELFGIEQSNGEQQRKAGALEEAHGGTLFIDEIGDMPRETQNKILRVLVDQTFQRSGGTTKVNVDVRIISSTARNLEDEIAEGRFREDLYHRLSVVPIRVPPLSERREDIPELIDYFMDQISIATGLPKRQIGQDAMAVLQSHVWPGNVRQLRNNVERVMILAGGGDHHGRYAAARRRFDGAGNADKQQWRAHHGLAAAGGAGSVRTRLSDRPDQPLFRQHFANRRICRHGAIGAASQAQGPRRRLNTDLRAQFMRLSANLGSFSGFSHEMPLCLMGLRRKLACLKTKPVF